jgi:tRNA (guanine-N1)-methyltransferase
MVFHQCPSYGVVVEPSPYLATTRVTMALPPPRSQNTSAALVMIEAIVRLLPDVLGNPASHQDDSHSNGLLEGPSYTRPPSWRELDVPEVLLSGDHAKIAAWRHEQGLRRTRDRRPDLLD